MADKLTLDKHAMNDKSTAHLRIYIGGLTDDATVDDLYNHFIEYGNIDGIIINRIFGFVQFQQESSAHEAINKANGSILHGRKITVRTAQRNGPKRETEVVNVQPDKPPAVSLSADAVKPTTDETTEDTYDAFGNYVGDRSYNNEEGEEGFNKPGWNEHRGGPRGRARGVRGRGRGGNVNFRERSPNRSNDWSERKYDRYPPPEFPRTLPTPERNDCEIIVVAKSLTEYAEYIEGRLKRLGIVVDLLFPMEDVPIGKVLGNIASRGCLYAILVTLTNQENRSLTLTILHGLPQEHRDMPLEDALQLLSRNFQEVQRGGPTGKEAVYALLGQLADGRSLTVTQYEKVIEYLQERKEQQRKIELGEPLATSTVKNKTEADLQQRILSILNDKKALSKPETPVVAPPPSKSETQNQLLNDPTVRKALDSILQKFV